VNNSEREHSAEQQRQKRDCRGRNAWDFSLYSHSPKRAHALNKGKGYANPVFGSIQFRSITKVIVGLQLCLKTDTTFVGAGQKGIIALITIM
jgi:hypothetical protein